MNKPNLAGMSIAEIRDWLKRNRKPVAQMSDQELKEYMITVPDDVEVEQEYIRRSTAQVQAKRKS